MAVTTDDIAKRLGRSLSTAEVAQVEAWIGDAEWLINSRAASLERSVNPDVQDRVVALAVVEMARNPQNETQVDVAIDDGRVSKRYSSGSGRVTIRDEWWALLDPNGGDGSAFAVDTYTGADRRHVHSDICSIFFGSPTCSCGAYLTLGQYPLYETWHGGVFPL